MAQARVETHSTTAGLTYSHAPPFSSFEALKVVSDSEPRPEMDPNDDGDFPGDLSGSLQKRFGSSALAQRQKGQRIIWLRFPVGDQLFWLVRAAEPIDHTAVVGAVFGRHRTRPGGHRSLPDRLPTDPTIAESDRGRPSGRRGEPPGTLKESGPQEIRDLSVGFNQMASDLKKIDAGRRLMLAGISHDLRTPLTHLRIAVELTAANAEPTIAGGMVHDIEDMDSILKQFLDYARDGSEEQPEEGDLTLSSTRCASVTPHAEIR